MGDSSCECPHKSYVKDFSEATVRAALGPAYEDYKNGDVHIRTTWEQDRSLVPYYLPECCTKLDADFKLDPLWLEHTIVLAVFTVVCLVLLGLFIALRNEQPFKFRDVKAVTLLTLLLIAFHAVTVMTGNEGGTSHPVMGIVAAFCGPPLITYYYIMKDLQLFYLISWGEAKLKKNNYERIQQFYRFRYLLDFRCYLAGLLVVILLTGIPVAYMLTSRDTFKNAMTRNTFDTVRCEWFHIPEQYQQPTSNSQLCECVKSLIDVEGESNAFLCFQAYNNKCTGSSADDDDEPNAEFCAACDDAFSTGDLTDKKCVNFFTDFIVEGNCGFPAMTPDISTCGTVVYADRVMSYVSAAILYFFTLVNLVVLIPLLGKRDDYGMVFENALSSTVLAVVFFFSSANVFSEHTDMLAWYYDGLGFKYRAAFLFTFIACWHAALCSLGIPLIMYLYRTKWWKPLTSEHLKSNASNGKSEHAYVTSGIDTIERPEIGSMLYVRQPRTDFEEAVQECVSHPSLLAIYSEYAVEAFHVENVRFLEETHQFFKMVDSYSDMVDLCVKATQILVQFVSNTAAFQVNLPAKLRLGVEKNLDVMMKMLTPVPDDPREENPVKREELRTRRASSVVDNGALDALVEALAQAYLEVRSLLAGDTWPRFRASRYYPRYLEAQKTLREQAARLTEAFKKLDNATPVSLSVRRTSGTHSPRSPSIHSLDGAAILSMSMRRTSETHSPTRSPSIHSQSSPAIIRRPTGSFVKSSMTESELRAMSEILAQDDDDDGML